MSARTLDGRVALVTGAGMGTGAATARLFAAAGAAVVVADFNEEAGGRTVADIEAAGGSAHYPKTDVARAEQVEATVDAAVGAYGRLDVAVNNAAITPDVAPLAEFDENYWDRLMAVNLKGVALSLKYAYVAAKHDVGGLTKVAARENGARNIRVNCVAPGAIDTPKLQASLARRGPTEDDFAPQLSLLNRFGTPEEVAQASLWLASDLSSYVTVPTIHADAGYTSS